MKTPGIHARLLFAAFMIISVTSFTLGCIGVKMLHGVVESQFEERFQFLARYLALNSELGILIDQRSMLARLAETLMSERDAAKVMIYNSAGERLAESFKEIPGPYVTVSALVRLKAGDEESRAFFWAPLTPDSKDTAGIIGRVEVTYSTFRIARLLRGVTLRFVGFTAGLAALFLLIFYFISLSLVSPLTGLAQTARKIGAGEYGLRMTPGGLPETREVSQAFNAMLDSLEQSWKREAAAHREMARQNLLAEMGKFSMMIAHEIKNPLGIIKSSFDILKTETSEDSRRMLMGYIEEEIQRINGLIEDFLSFAKPAKPSFQPMDVNRMLEEFLDRFQRLDSAKNIKIIRRIPKTSCLSYLDRDLWRRAIDNILKNAVEAGNGRGVIHVDAECREDAWRVEIADEGCGIPEDLLKKIFDPFVTTRVKGTGLGLAYTAQVVSAHGGTVFAKNRKEGGAVFCVEVPREPKMVDLSNGDGVRG